MDIKIIDANSITTFFEVPEELKKIIMKILFDNIDKCGGYKSDFTLADKE